MPRHRVEKLNPESGQPVTQLRGGPLDGATVICPPAYDRGNVHGIALMAPPENQATRYISSEDNWCVYVWVPSKQQYTWLDFLQTPLDADRTKVFEFLVDCMREACKDISTDGTLRRANRVTGGWGGEEK